jgi:hypothetical protein
MAKIVQAHRAAQEQARRDADVAREKAARVQAARDKAAKAEAVRCEAFRAEPARAQPARAEAAKAAAEKAESDEIAHENAVRAAKDLASTERLKGLEQEMQSFESELFKLNRLVRIQAELRNIQTWEEHALAEAKPHSAETKREREDKHRRRRATLSIKEDVPSRSEHNHESWSDMLSCDEPNCG